ncbi:MAG: 23S rRNA (uracil(1939)-C(5))-methyltransferase RlmD [Candidatus Omnitrophica bacterium]|nr:23S rRNA (uracil(1939)-C(5))-methyltransferase RlmD [Candidatus Omnitrophota bacterium]
MTPCEVTPRQIAGICKHFGVCGGCDSQDLPYEEQLKDKEARLGELFSQFNIKEIKRIIPSPEIYHYRNKMEYAVGVWDAVKVIGLREKKRFYRVVGLDECRIFNKDLSRIFGIFSDWIADNNIEPYHNSKGTGLLRYLALRHSKYYDDLMAIVVASSDKIDTRGLIDEFRKFKKIRSVYLCVNDGLSDVAVAGRLKLIDGDERIKERINGIDYSIGPESFFQTNSYCCGPLYTAIKEALKGTGGSALDLCCGLGGITLQVADIFSDVTGVDISERNIEDALINAKLNNIDNVNFICRDAEKYIQELSTSGAIKNFTVIILDPPRAGLSKKTRLAVRDSRVKNIIYVSCNPKNLGQDLKVLTEAYDIEKLIPVDMFPHTRHAEVIAILKSQLI